MTTAKTRIYIVDDHPLVRDWLAALIKQQPDLEYLGQAGDAARALSAMLETPPDVAIVDLTLPGSTGLDLIRNLTEQLPGTQAIVLTMHDELFYVERALRAGARGYVMKHESTNSILDAIRAVQTGHIYANPRLLSTIAHRIFTRNQPATGTAGKIETLSDRELDVFQRLGRGRTTRQIAESLHLSIKTIQSYCVRIKEKLNLTTSAELIYEAVSHHARTTPKQNL